MKKTITLVLLLLVSISALAQEPETRTDADEDWIATVEQFLRADKVPKQAFKRTWEAVPVQSIRLVRSGPGSEIEGFYPDYELTLHCATEESAEELGSYLYGPIDYIGKADVKMVGEFSSALTLSDFARLAILAEEFEVYAGMKVYPKSTVPEDPHTFLEIQMKDGSKHTLSEWGWQSPVEVWAFCSVIDKIWADRLNEAR